MGKYTKATFTASAAISGDGLWDEFDKIAKAHNKHVATDFTSSYTTGTYNTIPPGAVICKNGYFSMHLQVNATQTGSLALTTQVAYCTVPFACTLVRGMVIAATVGAGGTQKAVVYREDTPDVKVFSDVTMAAAGTPYDASTPQMADLSAGDVLSLRLVLPAAETTSYLSYTMLAKARHREA